MVHGEFFRKAREKAGLTQRELAACLGYTTPQFVSNWERGLCLPNASRLEDLAKLLKLKTQDLVDIYLAEYKKEILRNIKGESL